MISPKSNKNNEKDSLTNSPLNKIFKNQSLRSVKDNYRFFLQ